MASIHHWLPGHKFWEVYPDVLEPAPKLHIIGEAFSLNSGLAEGAVETAEYMLHEKMGPVAKVAQEERLLCGHAVLEGTYRPLISRGNDSLTRHHGRFAIVRPRLVAGRFIRKGSSLSLMGGSRNCKV